MKQIGKEEVVNLLNEKRYIVNEVIMRRISWYSYKEITILSVEKDRIIIRVRNTGSTVEEKDRERIFRKFYQCDTSHSMQGNGVGLAVVKRIVDLHSGSVRVDSENDLTEFTVVLPQPKLEK